MTVEYRTLSDGTMPREVIETSIHEELDKAYRKHGAERWGRHEFYAILKEEVDELWDAIKRDEPLDNVMDEAIDVAAMCFRYLETGDRYQYPPLRKATND